METDKATHSDFESLLNEIFEVDTPGPDKVLLTLVEVRRLGGVDYPTRRAPFSLTFAGNPQLRGPQQIYRLTHPRTGSIELFLVQIQPDQKASYFEAIFT